MYIGMAFWPGGTPDDWGRYYDTETRVYGINPCVTTGEYNGTGLSERDYLVGTQNLLSVKSYWWHMREVR